MIMMKETVDSRSDIILPRLSNAFYSFKQFNINFPNICCRFTEVHFRWMENKLCLNSVTFKIFCVLVSSAV